MYYTSHYVMFSTTATPSATNSPNFGSQSPKRKLAEYNTSCSLLSVPTAIQLSALCSFSRSSTGAFHQLHHPYCGLLLTIFLACWVSWQVKCKVLGNLQGVNNSKQHARGAVTKCVSTIGGFKKMHDHVSGTMALQKLWNAHETTCLPYSRFAFPENC